MGVAFLLLKISQFSNRYFSVLLFEGIPNFPLSDSRQNPEAPPPGAKEIERSFLKILATSFGRLFVGSVKPSNRPRRQRASPAQCGGIRELSTLVSVQAPFFHSPGHSLGISICCTGHQKDAPSPMLSGAAQSDPNLFMLTGDTWSGAQITLGFDRDQITCKKYCLPLTVSVIGADNGSVTASTLPLSLLFSTQTRPPLGVRSPHTSGRPVRSAKLTAEGLVHEKRAGRYSARTPVGFRGQYPLMDDHLSRHL